MIHNRIGQRVWLHHGIDMPDVGIIQNVGVVLSVNHNYGPERATYMVKLIDDPTPFKFAAHPDHFEWIE